jgi:hypothetical protein
MTPRITKVEWAQEIICLNASLCRWGKGSCICTGWDNEPYLKLWLCLVPHGDVLYESRTLWTVLGSEEGSHTCLLLLASLYITSTLDCRMLKAHTRVEIPHLGTTLLSSIPKMSCQNYFFWHSISPATVPCWWTISFIHINGLRANVLAA